MVTVNQILATAALLDGRYTAGLDQTGMSQKAGAVVSHLQISATPVDDRTAAVSAGQADLYLVFDLLSGAAPQHLARTDPQRTVSVVASSVTPTAAVVTNIATTLPPAGELLDRIRDAAGRTTAVDAARLSRTLFGDETTANIVLLGVAYQTGAVPLAAASIEEAIRLNGVAVEQNIEAFRAGRRHVIAPVTLDEPAAAARLGAAGLDPTPARCRWPGGCSTRPRSRPRCARSPNRGPPNWSTTSTPGWPAATSTRSGRSWPSRPAGPARTRCPWSSPGTCTNCLPTRTSTRSPGCT
ncbi:hypothetical protein GCM10027610_035230 [Dactylosporangium cerinum]